MSMNIGGPTRQVEKILSDLRAENARLQDGYDGLKYQYDEQHDELLRLQERVEQAERERDRALGELTASISEGHKRDEMYDKVIDERDRYKALAEQGVALVEAAQRVWDTIPATFDGPDAEEHSRALVALNVALTLISPAAAALQARMEEAEALAERRGEALEWDRWLIAMLVATEYTQHAEGCPREWDKECECWVAQVFTAAEARAAITATPEEAHVKLHAMFNAEDICKECGKPKDCVCHREHLKAVIIDEAREGQAT
ncbi:hypothetical protein LCGC14_2768780 [marine sediment metagenome]|uniref:Uncharacterized protein n=1 Tax=marine sediment metagenome TaxID=412755 RepID=A0A0F9B5L9_9ZZZZ